MAVILFQSPEHQGIRLPDPTIVMRLGDLAAFLIGRGCPSFTLPGNEMIDLVPDHLRGRINHAWLETGPGELAQHATVHIFAQERGGVIPMYDFGTRTFSVEPKQHFRIPPHAVPFAETLPIGGLALHAFAAALPDGVVKPLGARPWSDRHV